MLNRLSPAVQRQIGYLLLFIVFVASALPPGPATSISIEGADKLLHCVAYFVLSAWFAFVMPARKYLLLATWLFLFGVLIEVMHYFLPYRFASIGDLVANVAGIVLGLVTISVISRTTNAAR